MQSTFLEDSTDRWDNTHDVILFYTQSDEYTFNWKEVQSPLSESTKKKYRLTDENGRKYRLVGRGITNSPIRSAKDVDPEWEKTHPELVVRDYEREGYPREDWWYLDIINQVAHERTGFKTQKPETLLERIIKASSDFDDLVLDCFIGSGTTAAVAQKLGRKWIGIDVNKGAIQLTSKRIQEVVKEQYESQQGGKDRSNLSSSGDLKIGKHYSFATHRVNNYNLHSQIEANELVIQHLGIQQTKADVFFDGILGKNLVKIIDFNHPLTRLDLQLIIDEIKARPKEERDISVVCLGKELTIDPWIEDYNKKHPINKLNVIELRTDSKFGKLFTHLPAEADVHIKRDGNKGIVEINDFISPTIIERLNRKDAFGQTSLLKPSIPSFKSMIDLVLIDKAYSGDFFNITHVDAPKERSEFVVGKYEIDIPKRKNNNRG